MGLAHETREHGASVALFHQGGQKIVAAVARSEQGCGDGPGGGSQQAAELVTFRLQLGNRPGEHHPFGAAALKHQIVFHPSSRIS